MHIQFTEKNVRVNQQCKILALVQNIQQHSMNEVIFSIERFYARQLERWCKSILECGDMEIKYLDFLYRINKQLEMAVDSDDRIIQAIGILIKKHEFMEYNGSPKYRSPLRSRLQPILQTLVSRRFISKLQYILLRERKKLYLQQLLVQFVEFIQIIRQKQPGKQFIADTIYGIWRSTVKKNFLETWTFLMKNKVYEVLVYQTKKICDPIFKTYSIQKTRPIEEYNQTIIKMKIIGNTHSICTQGLFFTSQLIRRQNFEEQMNRFIIKNSIIFDEKTRKTAQSQINQVIKLIKSFNQTLDGMVYQLYGSTRIGYSLINECEADISIRKKQGNLILTKYDHISYLQQVHQALMKENSTLMAIIEPKLKLNLKTPSIKLTFQNDRVLKSANLTFDCKTGVEISKYLKLYFKSRYIIKLCNLIQLWAIRKTIINIKVPSEGLSSYGVILMVLFYLVKTQQAPYLKIQNQKSYLQNELMDQNGYNSLTLNFREFLLFYGEKGLFHYQKMVVCLMRKCVVNYSDKFFINMYDFTDNTNQGRMNRHFTNKYFWFTNQALKIINETRDISQLFLAI